MNQIPRIIGQTCGALNANSKPWRYRPARLASLALVSLLAITLLFPLAQAKDASRYPAPSLSSPFSRSLQRMLGVNHIAAHIGSQQLEKEIRKKVSGDVAVKIIPYSATDLSHGIARQLQIQGRGLIYDQAFFVSELDLVTTESTPVWIDLKSGDLKSPLEADVRVRITQADLNHSLATPTVRDLLNDIQLDMGILGKQRLHLTDSQAVFSPGRLNVKTRIASGSNTQHVPIEIETGLTPESGTGRVRLTNMKLAPIQGVNNLPALESFLQSAIEDMLEPSSLIPLPGSTFKVRSLAIENGQLLLRGHVRLVPAAPSPS